jgi:hypothetical protein
MSQTIEEKVREKYAAVAESTLSSAHRGVQAVAEAFGYSAEELAGIPAEANMGLSCGNPVVDTGKDLNAYAQVEGPGGCRSPAMETKAPAAGECCTPAPDGSSACCTPKEETKAAMAAGCCTPAPAGASACCTMTAPPGATVHGALADLLSKYDVNEFAASVQVFAVKGA